MTPRLPIAFKRLIIITGKLDECMCLRYIQEVTYQVHVDSKSNELSKKGDALLDRQELSVIIGAKEVIRAVIVCL